MIQDCVFTERRIKTRCCGTHLIPWPLREQLSYSRKGHVVITACHAKINTARWRLFPQSAGVPALLSQLNDLVRFTALHQCWQVVHSEVGFFSLLGMLQQIWWIRAARARNLNFHGSKIEKRYWNQRFEFFLSDSVTFGKSSDHGCSCTGFHRNVGMFPCCSSGKY